MNSLRFYICFNSSLNGPYLTCRGKGILWRCFICSCN